MWGGQRDPLIDKFREFLAESIVEKGGEGSGHRGHRGRPGQRGGSLPRGARGAAPVEAKPGEPEPVEGEHPLEPEPPEWMHGEITDIQQLKPGEGGVNTTYRGRIGDRWVILHPKSGLTPRRMRQHIPIQADNEREMAAAIINRAMGGYVDLPVGLIRDIPGHGPGFVQELRAGKDWDDAFRYDYGEYKNLVKFGDEPVKMGLFDAVIGNLDRHRKNFRIDETGGHLVAIDHGLAFPNINTDQAGNVDLAKWRSKIITGDEVHVLDNLMVRRGEIDGHLKKYLEPPDINAMWQRVDYMRREKKMYVPGSKEIRVPAPAAAEMMKPPKPYKPRVPASVEAAWRKAPGGVLEARHAAPPGFGAKPVANKPKTVPAPGWPTIAAHIRAKPVPASTVDSHSPTPAFDPAKAPKPKPARAPWRPPSTAPVLNVTPPKTYKPPHGFGVFLGGTRQRTPSGTLFGGLRRKIAESATFVSAIFGGTDEDGD